MRPCTTVASSSVAVGPRTRVTSSATSSTSSPSSRIRCTAVGRSRTTASTASPVSCGSSRQVTTRSTRRPGSASMTVRSNNSDAPSAHWRSSTMRTSGPSISLKASITETNNLARAPESPRSNPSPSGLDLGGGSAASRWCGANSRRMARHGQNGGISVAEHQPQATFAPESAAWSASASAKVVLPMPGSPRMTADRPRPSMVAASNPSSSASGLALPTIACACFRPSIRRLPQPHARARVRRLEKTSAARNLPVAGKRSRLGPSRSSYIRNHSDESGLSGHAGSVLGRGRWGAHSGTCRSDRRTA